MRHKMLADAVKANPPDVSLVSPNPHVQPLNSFAWLDDMSDMHRFDHYVVRGGNTRTPSPYPSPAVQSSRMAESPGDRSYFDCHPTYVVEPVEEDKTKFFLDDNCYGPKNCVLDSSWLKDAERLGLAAVGQKFYGFGEGYELVLPANGAKLSAPPAGHIAVFASQLDLGLRFPLDPTLEKLLRAFNICISLVHPASLHTLICLLWFLRFRRYPESLHLFKSLMTLKRSAFGTESGWYYVAPKESRVLSYPKLGCFRDWTGKFF